MTDLPTQARSQVYGPPLQCKHCGSFDVYWQKVLGQFVLYSTTDLEPHVCPCTPDGIN